MSHYSNQSAGKTASVLNFIATIVFSILLLIYLSLTVYTKDALWFYPIFNAQPSTGLIRCYGEEILLTQPSAHLTAITQLVNEQISGDKRWSELNLSDPTLEDYQTNPRMIILELYYDTPQRIHSFSPFFSNFDALLIPLDGRYADEHILFNLIRNKPGGGSFHVNDFTPVLNYIDEQALCKRQ